MPRLRKFKRGVKPFWVRAKWWDGNWLTTGWHKVFASNEDGAARKFMEGSKFKRNEIEVKPRNATYLF